MADFDLTQTDAQVQSILDDAQDAQGAGAQTTLTTDYIMLKGTNGRYHKILKDSFTEAVRNVLAGLLVNNDKGTTISQIPAIASGDFGSVTPANLASVLGGSITQLTNNTDITTVLTPGNYLGLNGGNYSNCPTSVGFRLEVRPCADASMVDQIIYVGSTAVNAAVTYRRFVNTASSPVSVTPWQQFYDTSLLTNSALLSPLASALGGLGRYLGGLDNNSDLNDYTDFCTFYYASNVTPGNMAPWTGYTTFVITIRFGSQNESVQFAFNATGGNFAMRAYNGSWNSWFNFTLTT